MEHIEDRGEKAFFILDRILNGSRKEFHLAAPPVSKNKDLDVLADIISFCLIVVTHLNPRTVSNMIDLICAATGYSLSKEDLRDKVRKILQMESRLQNKEHHLNDKSPFPDLEEGQISEILRREEGNNESIVSWTTS
jgi:aldehyde:ferredoxin oxidoreductase